MVAHSRTQRQKVHLKSCVFLSKKLTKPHPISVITRLLEPARFTTIYSQKYVNETEDCSCEDQCVCARVSVYSIKMNKRASLSVICHPHSLSPPTPPRQYFKQLVMGGSSVCVCVGGMCGGFWRGVDFATKGK